MMAEGKNLEVLLLVGLFTSSLDGQTVVGFSIILWASVKQWLCSIVSIDVIFSGCGSQHLLQVLMLDVDQGCLHCVGIGG